MTMWKTEAFNVNKLIENQRAKQVAPIPARQQTMSNQFGQSHIPMAPSTFQQPAPMPIQPQSQPQESFLQQSSTIFPFLEGSVFLLWKDFSPTAQQLVKEANVFPIKGDTYMIDHRDYHNEKEKIQAVKEFNALIKRYEDTVNRTGQYILVVGSVVDGIENREVITY